ncbi:MAG: molybdopterin biosynthesis protein, partial [Alphaproteobacteria bacterium]|nr:molybdopterin biosynthesis protein [Alphaproteobacteria bacterium]
MIFGDTDVKNASGCMLAHAINLNALKFPKGHTLSEADCKELYRNGINVVKVARLEDFDISENDAALIIAQAICSHEKIGRISIKRSRTGRVNLVAEQAGVVRLEKQAIVDANMVDHMITIATVPDFQQIKKGGLIATIKIISYAVDKNSVQKFCRLIS